MPNVNRTAVFGVWRGSLKRLFRAWISILSSSSISDLVRVHDSALFRGVGMVIRSCRSKSTRDSTLFKTSFDAIVFIVAVVA